MLAAIPSLLLCLLIARNSVLGSSARPSTILPEVATAPPAPDSPEVSPKLPRILEKTTVLRREKQSVNTTVLTKKTEEIVEEDDAAPTTNFPGATSLESSTSTMEFRPSVHIGEIHDYESRKSGAGPFNNVQHVKFENSVSIDDHVTGRAPGVAFHDDERAGQLDGQQRNHRVKFYDTDSRYGSVGVPVEYYVPQPQQQPQLQHQQQQHHTEEAVAHDEDNGNINNNNENDNHGHLMPMGHEGVVTFEYPMAHYAEVTARPVVTLARPVYPALMADPQMHLQHLQHYEPGGVRTIYVKPSKFHEEVATPIPLRVQHYEYVAPVVHEPAEKPEVLGHHQGSYQHQVAPQHADAPAVAKPDTVLVLSSHRETAYTRMRKFPYKFYHPEPVHHEHEYYYVPEVPAHGYPAKMMRASPWKKLIHLIGAFLPLGLLLAALKPNIVQLDTNSTQPNIVLSKLRDLPAEHKRGRLENGLDDVRQDPACEDKTICELIVSGSEPHANLLQNILWNLTNRSTDEEAKKHGLHEIFAAVRQKDCSSIDC